MSIDLPQTKVKRVSPSWLETDDLWEWPWEQIAPLPPLQLADGSGPAIQQTEVRLIYSDDALYVRFDCQDRDIWAGYQNHGDAIYDEEVVEVFIAPGTETPVDYYEIEISPDAVSLGMKVHNPDSSRATIQLIPWQLEYSLINWEVGRDDEANAWSAILEIPWSEIGGSDPLPTAWRANFYRIERPRDSEPEYSCWSPTLTEPADYHKPAQFGTLILG